MTTIIFIHGISVREPVLSQTFTQIKGKLLEELPNLTVVSCAWGDSLGAKLNADGASIPLYDSTRKDNQATQADENIIRWQQLYQDPLYELRLLSLKTPEKQPFTPRQETPSEKLDNKVKNFQPSDNLKAELQKCGIADIFADACKNVVNSLAYKDALKTISDNTLIEYRNAIARAIIATSITICEENKIFAPILTDSTLRDNLINSLSSQIIDSERGIGDWLKEQILKLGKPLATNHLKRKRGVISDITYPAVGDILLYQGRGIKIRDLIYKYIQEAEPPVVLLAHSLGGIACVDLLVEKIKILNQEEAIKKVKLLITVGSQAPYFYELNALQSLEFNSDINQRLPEKFPEWLNIYDLQDFLSYIGGNIFPRVQDILVDNQQPFPQSHSAYWSNKATWKAILPRIRGL